MKISEIIQIPSTWYRGGKRELSSSKEHLQTLLNNSKVLFNNENYRYSIHSTTNPRYKLTLDYTIYILAKVNNKWKNVAYMYLKKFSKFPQENAYSVLKVTSHEDFRNMGLVRSLYQLCLFPENMNGLGLVLVADERQTSGGTKIWAGLSKLDNIEVSGWIMFNKSLFNLIPNVEDYMSDLLGNVGGVYMGDNENYIYYQIPVGIKKDKLENIIDNSKFKIYTKEEINEYTTGLFAHYSGK